MAFIHKGRLKIIGDVFLDREEINNNVMFECDELIAPAICELNRRGYKTKYSCQGHYADIVMNDETKHYDTINAGYCVPYVSFEVEEIPSVPFGWKKFYTPKKLIDRSRLYTKIGTCVVESKKEIEDLLGYKVISYVSLYAGEERFSKETTFFEFYSDVLDLMEYLYIWAKSLKYNLKS